MPSLVCNTQVELRFLGKVRRRPGSRSRRGVPVTYFDSTTDEAAASPIALSAGSRAEANIALHALPALHLLVQSGKQEESHKRQSCGRPSLALRFRVKTGVR